MVLEIGLVLEAEIYSEILIDFHNWIANSSFPGPFTSYPLQFCHFTVFQWMKSSSRLRKLLSPITVCCRRPLQWSLLIADVRDLFPPIDGNRDSGDTKPPTNKMLSHRNIPWEWFFTSFSTFPIGRKAIWFTISVTTLVPTQSHIGDNIS